MDSSETAAESTVFSNPIGTLHFSGTKGEGGFLSQWYKSPFEGHDGTRYISAEQLDPLYCIFNFFFYWLSKRCIMYDSESAAGEDEFGGKFAVKMWFAVIN